MGQGCIVSLMVTRETVHPEVRERRETEAGREECQCLYTELQKTSELTSDSMRYNVRTEPPENFPGQEELRTQKELRRVNHWFRPKVKESQLSGLTR